MPLKSLKAKRRARNAGLVVVSTTNSRWRRLRLWGIWLFLTLICGYLDSEESQRTGFSYFNNYFSNIGTTLWRWRNADVVDWARKQIVIVPVSDNTFSPDNPERRSGPPVSRRDHARVLHDLRAAGARVVVFDFLFKLPGSDAKADDALAQAAKGKGKGAPTVWACLIENDDLDPHLALPIEKLVQASPHYGHILGFKTGQSLVFDRVQSVYQSNGRVIPSLSVEAARIALGLGNEPIQKRGENDWQIGSLHLPNVFNIQYVTDRQDDTGTQDGQDGIITQTLIFKSVPFEQMVAGAANDPFYSQNKFFKDKIVIIGDTTKLGNDFRNTPAGYMPGVEIQANAIASVLMAKSGAAPITYNAAPWVSFVLLSALTGLSCFLASRLSIGRSALAVLLLIANFLLYEVLILVDHGVILHTAGPLIALVLGASLVFFERGFWEEREKTYMRGLLGRYVSPSVADYILRYPERCAFGGEVYATVLFADIRGFTTLTTQIPPRVTLRVLNEYFQAMSDVVFQYDGTVDKFIGDAIMAIFGAPVESTDHATRAVCAAVEMEKRLKTLQAQWKSEGLPEITIGIGVATGTMIIGNMGSDARADFSVVGDAVNLAARLQEINKELDTTILISGSTYSCLQSDAGQLPPHIGISSPQSVSVRGHTGQEEVYAVDNKNSVAL